MRQRSRIRKAPRPSRGPHGPDATPARRPSARVYVQGPWVHSPPPHPSPAVQPSDRTPPGPHPLPVARASRSATFRQDARLSPTPCDRLTAYPHRSGRKTVKGPPSRVPPTPPSLAPRAPSPAATSHRHHHAARPTPESRSSPCPCRGLHTRTGDRPFLPGLDDRWAAVGELARDASPARNGHVGPEPVSRGPLAWIARQPRHLRGLTRVTSE